MISRAEGKTPWKIALPLEGAANRKGVSKLWARKKIASLELARARAGSERAVLDDKILDVALAHSLISRLTSLVAVDITPSRPNGENMARADIRLNLPRGWNFEKVFGEETAPRQREALASPLLQTRVAYAIAPAGQGGSGVALPQGATLADVKIMRGILFLTLAFLFLFLTLRPQAAFWRADATRDAH